MSSFIAFKYDIYTDRLLPTLAAGGDMAVFSSVAEAETLTGGDVANIFVLDTAKRETPVALTPPGTLILNNGQWVASK